MWEKRQESVLTEDIRPEQTVARFDPEFPEYAVIGVSPKVIRGVTIYKEIMWVPSPGNVTRGHAGKPHKHKKGAAAHMIGIALPENSNDPN